VPAKSASSKARRVTLAAVGRRANSDRGFFKALLQNPGEALAAAGLSLNARDMEKLTSLVGEAARNPARDGGFVVMVKERTILKVMARRRVSSDEGWPSPFWPMKWQSLRFKGPGYPAELELVELPSNVRLPGIH
jgi:hypothetical protein